MISVYLKYSICKWFHLKTNFTAISLHSKQKKERKRTKHKTLTHSLSLSRCFSPQRLEQRISCWQNVSGLEWAGRRSLHQMRSHVCCRVREWAAPATTARPWIAACPPGCRRWRTSASLLCSGPCTCPHKAGRWPKCSTSEESAGRTW